MTQLPLFATEPTPGPPLIDAAGREQIRHNLDDTLFVEAAAGTGKTTELVARIVALLKTGRSPLYRIVVLTFTDKAAGELKLRLREDIERARRRSAPAEERAFLDRALSELETAPIATIHAFCADLLREYPVAAAIDPLFQLIDEEETEQLLSDACHGWLDDALADPPPGLHRFLRRRHVAAGTNNARALLVHAVLRLAMHRDYPGRWSRPPLERGAALDRLITDLDALARLAERAAKPDDALARSLAELAKFAEESRLFESTQGRDDDLLEGRLAVLAKHKLWDWRGRATAWYCRDITRDAVLAQRAAFKAALDETLAQSDADLAAALQDELQPVVARYEALKQSSGRLDFLDLLLRARNLVRDHPAIRRELQARYAYFFVDEFQDTDPLQAELLLLLAGADPAQRHWADVRVVPGKLFLVGDPKQSIYRFRRADIAVYAAVKAQLVAQGAKTIALTASFRSVPAIQEAVNAAFGQTMLASDGQPAYTPLHPVRRALDEQPALIALPAPRPYGTRNISKKAIDASYPDAVGALVHWLISESNFTVGERFSGGERRVAIEARHICLLFRRFVAYTNDVTRSYVRALEARRIPHVLVGGRSFHSREEVLALRNLLAAIEWPDDELRVFAALRGPLLALNDEALFLFRQAAGALHPLRPPPPIMIDEAFRSVAEALALLGRFHQERNRRPIRLTILALLAALRAHAAIALWPTGEQALANLARLVDLARAFEAAGGTSFRAFVQHLDEGAARGDAAEAPVVEEGTDGVRMMTVHKAKGLEFPVVILVDPTAALTRKTPSFHVDPARELWAEPLAELTPQDLRDHHDSELTREREEAIRLAYVAATRARDLLVVPVVGDEKPDCWLRPLYGAIYPPLAAWRTADAAPGCPRIGDETVLHRPVAAHAHPQSSVAPGRHLPEVGQHTVVWWDPQSLTLDVEIPGGLTHLDLLKADAAQPDNASSAVARWTDQRRTRLTQAAQPLFRVMPVTEVAAQAASEHSTVAIAAAGQSPIRVEAIPLLRSGRPGGSRFGTLVHNTLAVVDYAAPPATIVQTVAYCARLLQATEAEQHAAADAVERALAHPLLRQAAQAEVAGTLHREMPLLLACEDGMLLEGVVDLAYRSVASKGWIVIDIKTDQVLEPHLAAYQRQLQLYVHAITTATDDTAQGILLWV